MGRAKERHPIRLCSLGAPLALGLILFFNLLISPSAQAALGTCQDLFSSTPSRPTEAPGVVGWLHRSAQRTRAFDYDLFLARRSQYETELASGGLRPGSRVEKAEERLALLEATAAHKGHDVLGLAGWLKHADSHSQKEVRRILRAVRFDGRGRSGQVEDAFARLYLITRADPLQARTFFLENTLPDTVKVLIQRRFEAELAAHDTVSALENMGLVRADLLGGRIRDFRSRHQTLKSNLETIALNLLTFQMFGLPMHFPGHQPLSKAPPLSPSLRQELLHKPFEQVYPQLEALYGRQARLEIGLHWVRKVYYRGLMGLGLALVAAQLWPDEWTLQRQEGFADSAERRALLDDAYLIWKDVQRDFLGAAPSDESPDAIAQRRYLQTLSDDDLWQLVEDYSPR